MNLIDDEKGIIKEYSNRSRQIILDEDNPYDSQGRYNIVGVDPDDGLFTQNRYGQSSYQWNLGFKYQFLENRNKKTPLYVAFFYVNLGPFSRQTFDAYSTACFRQISVDNFYI